MPANGNKRNELSGSNENAVKVQIFNCYKLTRKSDDHCSISLGKFAMKLVMDGRGVVNIHVR